MASGTRLRPRLYRAITSHPLIGGRRWEPFAIDCENLEPFVSELIAIHPALLARQHQILIALEEARNNILRHTVGPDRAIGFVNRGEQPHEQPPDRSRPGNVTGRSACVPNAIEFLFADTGPGFVIDGMLPPYPANMVGRTYDFRWTIDGVVSCHVADPETIVIEFRGAPSEGELSAIGNLASNGLGLSIISKVMDKVTYITHVGPENLLWLQLEIPGKSNR